MAIEKENVLTKNAFDPIIASLEILRTEIQGYRNDLDGIVENLPALTNLANSTPEMLAINQALSQLLAIENEIDKLLDIYTNLPALGDIHTSLPALNDIHGSLAGLNSIAGALPALNNIEGNLPALVAIEGAIPMLNALEQALPEITAVHSNLSSINSVAGIESEIQAIAGNIQAILDAPTHAQTAVDAKEDSEEARDESRTWAEGTDQEVDELGGEKSSRGWAGESERFAGVSLQGVKFKDKLNDTSELPSDPEPGDSYAIEDNNAVLIYVWSGDGQQWESFSLGEGTSWGQITGIIENQTDLANWMAEKADWTGVYTKAETDQAIADAEVDAYTKQESDTKLAEKADKADTYTKTEADDLLDDKFDKSGGTIEGVTIIETDSANGLEIIRTGSNGGRARLRILNANNSGLAPEFTITGDGTSDTPGLPVYIPGRISTRDGFYIGSTRKDLEWDAKADLEGGNEFAGDQAVVRTRVKHQISKFIGNAPGNNECIILFGPSSETIHIAGTILAVNDVENTQRDQMRINLTASTGSSRYNVSLQKNTGWHPDIRIVTCEYNSETHSGLLIGGTFGTQYPNRYFFEGVVVGGESYPLALPASSVTNIESEIANNESQNIFISDTTIYTGTVTADDFITASRVESDNENALRALDNISEWKKKDGTIDYKKHYAYTPRIIKDEAGKIIEEKPGLSMEKRVAMLEKMVAELSEQLPNEKTQRE